MIEYHVIINKDSGKIKNMDDNEFEAIVTKVFSDHGIESVFHWFAGKGIIEGIKKVIDNKPKVILIAGGDGTVNTAAALMRKTGIALGILPLGTFNLAARDYGIPLELEPALHALAEADIKALNLLTINDLPCLCTCMIGFYPRMAQMIDEYHGKPWWRKSLRILWWSVWRFVKMPTYKVGIKAEYTKDNGVTDKIDRELKSRMIAITPSTYKDTLGLIPERETILTSIATVYVFRHLSRFAMLQGMLRFFLGLSKSDNDMEPVIMNQGSLDFKNKKQVKVIIDGEYTNVKTPVNIALEADALTLLLPVSTKK